VEACAAVFPKDSPLTLQVGVLIKGVRSEFDSKEAAFVFDQQCKAVSGAIFRDMSALMGQMKDAKRRFLATDEKSKPPVAAAAVADKEVKTRAAASEDANPATAAPLPVAGDIGTKGALKSPAAADLAGPPASAAEALQRLFHSS